MSRTGRSHPSRDSKHAHADTIRDAIALVGYISKYIISKYIISASRHGGLWSAWLSLTSLPALRKGVL